MVIVMAYCSQCGAKLEDDARFCTLCGAKVDGSFHTASANKSKSNNQSGFNENSDRQKKSGSGTSFETYLAYTDTTASYRPGDCDQNRLVAVLSYLHILVIVPLIGMRESPFTQYHAKIGLNLLIWHLVAEVGGDIICNILDFIPVIDWIAPIAVGLINLALWGINIFGIVSAAQGKARELEIFAPFKIIK